MKNSYSIESDVAPLARLAIPLLLTGMMQSSAWFFQTLFLAHLGQQSIAAGGLVSWMFITLVVIVFGMLSSINILVSHRHGANDQEGIAIVARDGIWLAVLLAIPTVILLRNMSAIFLAFGQPQSVVELVKPYLNAISWGLMADFITRACISVILGTGRARISLFFSMISISSNVIFSYLFIFGKFGIPAFGIAGAGWGMSVSYLITLTVMILFIRGNHNIRQYFRYVFQFQSPVYFKELLRVGIPMGLMHCVEVAFFFTITLAMGLIGAEVQAANQIALQYLNLMMAMIFSLAQAISVRMGYLLGANKVPAAERAGNVGAIFALIFVSIVGVIYWIFPNKLISFDLDISNPSNISIMIIIQKFLAAAAIFQLFEAMRIAMFGALRSLKDTKFTLATSTISFWCIAIPIGYYLSNNTQLSGLGYWCGMIFGAIVGLILLRWRFNSRFKQYYKNGEALLR